MIGQLLHERYRITQVLAWGGFGQTYLAEDISRPTHPLCVVKQLQIVGKKPLTVKVGPRLFKKEAEVLGRLGKHNQIPQLLAHFEENNEFFLVEEYIPGEPLNQEIVSGQPLSEERVISFLKEILEILVFVHKHGVIHRDIKPANIIRRETDGKLVLIDFGSVKEIGTQFAQEAITQTVAIGTRAYMPIEQFQGYPQFNSDIYALGIMAIQAVTGLSTEEILNLQNPKTGEIVWRNCVKVSSKFANVIDQMIHFDCHRRYKSAREVMADISCIVASSRRSAVASKMTTRAIRCEKKSVMTCDPSSAPSTPNSSPHPITRKRQPQIATMLLWVSTAALVGISGLSVALWHQLPNVQSIEQRK